MVYSKTGLDQASSFWRTSPLTCRFMDKCSAAVVKVYGDRKPIHAMPAVSRDIAFTDDQVKRLVNAMSAAQPHALANTEVHTGGAKIKGRTGRILDNERLSNTYRYLVRHDGDMLEDMLPSKTQQVPDAFLQDSDQVWLPSRSPGVLMHELGHAIDLNGATERDRKARLRNSLYRNLAPTLWTEHAAWRKGDKAFRGGAIDSELSVDDYTDTALSAHSAKRMGLGSYWGAGIGGLAGLATAVAGLTAIYKHYDGRIPRGAGSLALASSLLVSAGGALAGSAIGSFAGSMSEEQAKEFRRKAAQRYVSDVAESQGVSEDEARKIIQARGKALAARARVKKAA